MSRLQPFPGELPLTYVASKKKLFRAIVLMGAAMTAQPVRVLVVDDSALMRKLIPQIL